MNPVRYLSGTRTLWRTGGGLRLILADIIAGIVWGFQALWNLLVHSDFTIVFLIAGYGIYLWWVFS